MLYTPVLAPLIQEQLKTVVLLQVELLRYAATEIEIDKTRCAEYLDEGKHDKQFCGRGKEIAEWYWQAPKRKKYLSLFTTLPPEDREQKKEWCERIACEVNDLLNEKLEKIPIGSFLGGEKPPNCKKDETICTWKDAAYCFFLYFYDHFLGNSGPEYTFPGVLFKNNQAFGRQDFFKAFVESNKKLVICPACDEGRYYTHVGDYYSGTIDHYLPKSRYPHFACHPHNLIPICHSCNSLFKGTSDLLSLSGGAYLLRSMLPYTKRSGDQFYLQVTLKDKKDSVAIKSLAARTNKVEQADQDIEKAIDTLKRFYGIPDRWDGDTIGETLFRRIRQFLDNGNVIPDSYNTPSEIYNSLEQLLYYLDQVDRQREPLAFALTWALVALIKEQLIPYLSKEDIAIKANNATGEAKKPYLLEEIEKWFNPKFVEEITERSNRAKELLSIPGETSSAEG